MLSRTIVNEMLPSALVHISLRVSIAAPTKPAGVVAVNADRFVVCTVQIPLLLTPSLRLQSDGTPETVTVTAAPVPDWSVSPILIGLPAVPAGNVMLLLLR